MDVGLYKDMENTPKLKIIIVPILFLPIKFTVSLCISITTIGHFCLLCDIYK